MADAPAAALVNLVAQLEGDYNAAFFALPANASLDDEMKVAKIYYKWRQALFLQAERACGAQGTEAQKNAEEHRARMERERDSAVKALAALEAKNPQRQQQEPVEAVVAQLAQLNIQQQQQQQQPADLQAMAAAAAAAAVKEALQQQQPALFPESRDMYDACHHTREMLQLVKSRHTCGPLVQFMSAGAADTQTRTCIAAIRHESFIQYRLPVGYEWGMPDESVDGRALHSLFVKIVDKDAIDAVIKAHVAEPTCGKTVYAVLGNSGVGKSTLCNYLFLLEVDDFRELFGGKPRTDIPVHFGTRKDPPLDVDRVRGSRAITWIDSSKNDNADGHTLQGLRGLVFCSLSPSVYLGWHTNQPEKAIEIKAWSKVQLLVLMPLLLGEWNETRFKALYALVGGRLRYLVKYWRNPDAARAELYNSESTFALFLTKIGSTLPALDFASLALQMAQYREEKDTQRVIHAGHLFSFTWLPMMRRLVAAPLTAAATAIITRALVIEYKRVDQKVLETVPPVVGGFVLENAFKLCVRTGIEVSLDVMFKAEKKQKNSSEAFPSSPAFTFTLPSGTAYVTISAEGELGAAVDAAVARAKLRGAPQATLIALERNFKYWDAVAVTPARVVKVADDFLFQVHTKSIVPASTGCTRPEVIPLQMKRASTGAIKDEPLWVESIRTSVAHQATLHQRVFVLWKGLAESIAVGQYCAEFDPVATLLSPPEGTDSVVNLALFTDDD